MALQLLGAADGRLAAGDELRFSASETRRSLEWGRSLLVNLCDQPGQRIARQDSGPASAPQRPIGHEAGRWQPYTIFDSTRPGPAGDHWFAGPLRSGPDQEIEPITIPLTSMLPLTAGPVTLAIVGSATTAGQHQLAMTAGTATASVRWHSSGNWTQMITLDTEATTATIALLPAAMADQVLLDRVQWTRRE